MCACARWEWVHFLFGSDSVLRYVGSLLAIVGDGVADDEVADPTRLVCKKPDMNETVLPTIRTLAANLFTPLNMDIFGVTKKERAPIGMQKQPKVDDKYTTTRLRHPHSSHTHTHRHTHLTVSPQFGRTKNSYG